MSTDTHTTRDVLEQLCWYLNYHTDESLDPTTIAEETDIEWARVYNSLLLLETLQNIAPRVTYDSNNKAVTVGVGPSRIADVLDDPALATVVYLFIHGKHADGSITDPIDIEEHRLFENARYRSGLDDAVEIDWVERTNDGVVLTPRGVGVAGPLHSRIQNNV